MGVCIVFSLTDRASFTDLEVWLDEVAQYTKEGTSILIFGNKSDLQEQRVVSENEALAFAQEHNIAYMETSAKDGTNVNEAFQLLVNGIGTIFLTFRCL